MLLSNALMSAADRSCAVAGVVTCDDMLLSKHHFTKAKQLRKLWKEEKERKSPEAATYSSIYVSTVRHKEQKYVSENEHARMRVSTHRREQNNRYVSQMLILPNLFSLVVR